MRKNKFQSFKRFQLKHFALLLLLAPLAVLHAANKPAQPATGIERVALRLTFGITDQESTSWDGKLVCDEGLTIESAGRHPAFYPEQRGGLELCSDRLLAWKGGSKKDPIKTRGGVAVHDPDGKPLRFPLQVYGLVVQMVVRQPGTVSVTTPHGSFTIDPAALPFGQPRLVLDGRVTVERAVPTLTAGDPVKTGPVPYRDFPAICSTQDGATWTAFVCYTGKPEPSLNLKAEPADFEFLKQAPCNDQLFVVREQAGVRASAVPLTAPGLDLYSPAITCDRQGRVAVVWSQGSAANWDLYGSVLVDGKWSPPARLTTDAAPDINVVAASHNGETWVSWQTFVAGTPQIMLGRLSADGRTLESVTPVTDGSASCWMPSLAIANNGTIAVGYDTYAKGDYDVHCALFSPAGKLLRQVPVAASLRFEAKASVVFDRQNRLWIAWEEAGENWGKDGGKGGDFSAKKDETVAIDAERTLRVTCLVDGKLLAPKVCIETLIPQQQAMLPVVGTNSVRTLASLTATPRRFAFDPKLAAGNDGRIYLLYREKVSVPTVFFFYQTIWADRVAVYEGERWLAPVLVNGSAGPRHCMPSVCALPEGGIAVASAGDGRDAEDKQICLRNQNVRIGRMLVGGTTATAVADQPVSVVPASPSPSVLNERAAVRRLRDYRVTVAGRELRILSGDFHRHTAFSNDGILDGNIRDAFRYALDAAALSTMMNSDHDAGYYEYPWYVIQKLYDMHLLPGNFITMFGYERSRGDNAIGGHRNVVMATRGTRMLPGFGMEKTDEHGSVQDTRMLFRCLREIGAISIPHTIGTHQGPNFVDYAPDVDPVVEIYQGERNSYEYPDCPRGGGINGRNTAGFFWSLLAAGKKYGVIASSDHESTHKSYAMLYVTDMSRDGVMDALRKRHCYAATDNILLDVHVGDRHLMGDALSSAVPPTLTIHAVGTAPIKQLDIIRNAAILETIKVGKEAVQLNWTDRNAPAGENSYYVRVLQEDGELAWGSPIWVTVK